MKKLTIPKYTLGEEVTNSITHGLGVFFGIVILVLTIVMSAHNHNTVGVVASCIYGTSMIIMFLISCLYHAMSPRIGAKKVFRVLDHCDIYVFIAGSYTPFCISLIGGKVGWTLFGIIWGCALLGVLLNSIDLEKFKIMSFVLYLIMGWMIVISFNSLNAVLPTYCATVEALVLASLALGTLLVTLLFLFSPIIKSSFLSYDKFIIS